MDICNFKSVYFLGAGGIGMSALVRYFLSHDIFVAGYDLVESELTRTLCAEGASIHYEDNVSLIPEQCLDKETTLVVITPAVPENHTESCYFRNNGFSVMKRAQVLGLIVNAHKPLGVAGTHGKTTTSTMLAHILNNSHLGCNAFLGGISKNVGSNLILNKSSELYVVESDEFDRSFHNLRPYMTVVTSMDPDHLDIYGNYENYVDSFRKYVSLIQDGGVLVVKKGLENKLPVSGNVRVFTYSKDEGDFQAENVKAEKGEIYFDFVGPDARIDNLQLGVPLYINIENSVAAVAMALLNGASEEEIRNGVSSFKGVNRRFDFVVKNEKHVLVSDYAHHPVEIRKSVESVRFLYPDRKITGVFQPHLYTRTRDLYKEFAESLSLLDEVIILDIYPAREKPIEGVTSEMIYNNIKEGVKKELCSKNDLLSLLSTKELDVLMTIGAGNIDSLVPEIAELMNR